MRNNLKEKTIGGLFWKTLEQVFAKLVGAIVSIILARLLIPEDYAAIALITVFITISEIFITSGFSSALIQKKEADDLDFSSVFYASLALSLVFYAIIFFCAPFVSYFYDMPILTPVLRVMAISIIIASANSTQQAYVSRDFSFKKFFFATLIGTIISAAVGIFLAYNGYGVWALVGQNLTNLLIDTLVLWFTVKWRPRLMFSFSRLKGLLSFGGKLLFTKLFSTIYDNIRTLVIGKVYSKDELAYFSKGREYPNTINNIISDSLNTVLFSTISKIQDNPNEVKAAVKRSIKLGTFIVTPIMLGLFAISNTLIIQLFTSKWSEMIFYFQIFCICYLFLPINSINYCAIKALGRSDILLKQEVIKKIIGTIFLVGALFISVKAVAISSLLSLVFYFVINCFPNKKLFNYGIIEQIKDFLSNVLVGLTMCVPVYFMNYIHINGWILLIVQVFTGASIYIGICFLFKNESFYYCVDFLRAFFNERKKL